MQIQINWQQSAPVYELEDKQIHIWRVQFPLAKESQALLLDVLNQEELQRQQQYRFAHGQQQFLASRGLLRILLAKYLKQNPNDITIQATKHGKLLLPRKQNPNHFVFNLSHSKNCLLFAFTKQVLLGIDVEYPERKSDWEGIAKRFFADSEVEQFLTVSEDLIPVVFFNTWTRKEAYIKAIGEGLSHPLKDFAVTLLPNETPRLSYVKDLPDEPDNWTFLSFNPYPEYIAAVAVRMQQPNIQFYDCQCIL